MARHITEDSDGPFTYQCQNCGETKLDTEFEPTGSSEVCLVCEELKNGLQVVYGDILTVRGIKYGDIEPLLAVQFEEVEKILAILVNKWLKGLA